MSERIGRLTLAADLSASAVYACGNEYGRVQEYEEETMEEYAHE